MRGANSVTRAVNLTMQTVWNTPRLAAVSRREKTHALENSKSGEMKTRIRRKFSTGLQRCSCSTANIFFEAKGAS